jgi:hypothetical protein
MPGNAGAAKPPEQGAEGSTVWFMPNLSKPRPPNYKTCPILLIEYPAVQDGNEKHYSFGFVATSFQPVQMNVGPSNAALPAIVWEGKESVLGLVFTTDAARAKCIKRLGRDKPFGLSLERDLHDSFLLRNFSRSSPTGNIELYQFHGKNHIMSRRIGRRCFVTVNPKWSEPPHFFPFESIGKLGSSGNWVFVVTQDDANWTYVCIIECASPTIARDVVSSFKRRAQRQISTGDAILSVTIRDADEGDFTLRSHSEEGQPNRVPFNTAWAQFLKSIKEPAA